MVISLTVSPSVVFTSVARKEECYFRSRGAPKPLNRFTRNLARLTMSAVRPHMQNMVAAATGWGDEIEVATARAFFLVPLTHPQPTKPETC